MNEVNPKATPSYCLEEISRARQWERTSRESLLDSLKLTQSWEYRESSEPSVCKTQEQEKRSAQREESGFMQKVPLKYSAEYR